MQLITQSIKMSWTRLQIHNYNRDGESTIISQGGAPNYFPNSFNGPKNDKRARALAPKIPLSGLVDRTDYGLIDNYSQARLLWTRVSQIIPDKTIL